MLTNRPKSPAQQLFENMPAPSFFHLSRAISRAMDADFVVPSSLHNRFYVNRTLPFGVAGFMEVQQTGAWKFAVQHFDAGGKEGKRVSVDLWDIATRELEARALIAGSSRDFPGYVNSQSTP